MKGQREVLHTQSVNLTRNASIFQAELIAIQEAAKHLITHEDTQLMYMKFFSDSQAALQALNQNYAKLKQLKIHTMHKKT